MGRESTRVHEFGTRVSLIIAARAHGCSSVQGSVGESHPQAVPPQTQRLPISARRGEITRDMWSVSSGQSSLVAAPAVQRAKVCAHVGLGTSSRRYEVVHRTRLMRCNAADGTAPEESEEPKDEVDNVAKKWGLEAGLFKAMTSKGEGSEKSGTEKAKELLTKYGSAYLITSTSFALVSFAICYALVNAGVDVRALLTNFGLQVGETGEKVGKFAIAYAAHKALSPVRFPPTVALTPVVANMMGKKAEDDETVQVAAEEE